MNQMVAQGMLEALGRRCRIAEDGLVGVAAWRETRARTVLMDVSMPGMDGLAATREIRRIEAAEPGGARTWIIGLTAHAMAGDRQRCLDAGMDDHVPKPVASAALQSALERAEAANGGAPARKTGARA